ncbi:hypothetical protein ACOQFV_19095 [Nocardiopsis changdeensis]|uniref:Uncharacterized protein n=1 Tax=Nocardiopsis changdeensis TaxID=2831969 RepID=A0ABX8BSF8_9ACTN|nr:MULTISPECIES: hypothetical protein [Nocardiopsis]QUX23766.1 hypothetical protein KGD84_05330 [Nocardiopsis changdeensis]QYX39712.1 hypothetical protein K1J57_14785 [Nocardiopsis sp. MT53]
MTEDPRTRPAPAEDPDAAVPEADAAEQRLAASDAEDDEHWLERAGAGELPDANEADVVEQLREAGADDDDRR